MSDNILHVKGSSHSFKLDNFLKIVNKPGQQVTFKKVVVRFVPGVCSGTHIHTVCALIMLT